MSDTQTATSEDAHLEGVPPLDNKKRSGRTTIRQIGRSIDGRGRNERQEIESARESE